VGILCGLDCWEAMYAYDQGTVVTLTAFPESGSSFTGWSEQSCSDSSDCVVRMDQARSISASFTGFPWPLFVPAFTTGNRFSDQRTQNSMYMIEKESGETETVTCCPECK
jgi:Divergent InlB B-repeat domain